jgi:hypothetical protein
MRFSVKAAIPSVWSVVANAEGHAFHVEEGRVPFGVVGERGLQRHGQQVVLEAHESVGEDPGVHQSRFALDDGLETHVREESVVGAVRQQAEDTTKAVRGATKTDK